MENYIKIMKKIIEYNNKLTKEIEEDNEDIILVGEKKATERIMLEITNIMSNKTFEIKETENIVYVSKLKWAGIAEDIRYNGNDKVYFIDSIKYGYVQAYNYDEVIQQFKTLVRQRQLEDIDDTAIENTSLA